jgi:hypothetical protein
MDIQLQNQLKRLVEVTALVGLSLHAHREAKVVSELEKYAFPNELAEKINKEISKCLNGCGDEDCEGGCDDLL